MPTSVRASLRHYTKCCVSPCINCRLQEASAGVMESGGCKSQVKPRRKQPDRCIFAHGVESGKQIAKHKQRPVGCCQFASPAASVAILRVCVNTKALHGRQTTTTTFMLHQHSLTHTHTAICHVPLCWSEGRKVYDSQTHSLIDKSVCWFQNDSTTFHRVTFCWRREQHVWTTTFMRLWKTNRESIADIGWSGR